MLHLHVEVHHLIHVEGFHPARNYHAQRVAHKVPRVFVVHKLGIRFQNLALFRLFHVSFNRQHPAAPRFLQQLVHHAQRRQITCLPELRSPEYPRRAAGNLPENPQRIRNQQRAHPRPADNQQLRRLHQHRNVPVLHQIAAQHGAKHDENPDDREHGVLRNPPSPGVALSPHAAPRPMAWASAAFIGHPAVRHEPHPGPHPGLSCSVPPIPLA
jgi:hypothetical protein